MWNLLAGADCVTNALKTASSLASALHSSGRLKDEFEESFGQCSIPKSCVTRWGSLHKQIKAVTRLDARKLTAVLERCGKTDLDVSAEEREQLAHLTRVLEPFSQATDVTQGELVCVGFKT